MRFFRCTVCKAKYPVETINFRCKCGAPFELVHDCSFKVEDIDRETRSIWRYRRAIPVEQDENIVTLGEGFTPTVPLNYRGLNVLVKLEYMSPTGSFKDRGASVLFSFLREIGIESVVEDSSGNAGVSASAYGARAGIECEIFCPEYASGGKLTQIEMYGARVVKVGSTREVTAEVARGKAGIKYYASHNWHPFFIEGLKTLAFEIAEQFGWRIPENIVLPLGFGGLYYGLYLGFKCLIENGLTSGIPRLLGVQSEMCCPIYDAFMAGCDVDPRYVQKGKTIAEGICGAKPVFWKQIMTAAEESRGGFTIVSDAEIITGLNVLLKQGFLVEPTSAVVVKGMENFLASGVIGSQEQTLLILTGSGLKTLPELRKILIQL